MRLPAPSGLAAGDQFGRSVALSGDYAIVGARGDDANGEGAGAAYVYHRTDTTTWDDGIQLPAPSGLAAGHHFGCSVALSGDYAIVGAQGDDANGEGAGAAYVYHRTDTNAWDAGVRLPAPSGLAAGHQFGRSVALSGDYAIVGAQGDDANGNDAGAAYIYRRSDTNVWDAGVKLPMPNLAASDYFGFSTAISDGFAVIGAYGDRGVGGNFAAGAAYLWRYR